MTTLRLRDYQQDAITAIGKAWLSGMRRPAVVLPTGAGKTVVFAELIRQARETSFREAQRVIVLVHTDELCDQALAKIRAAAPDLSVGKVKAKDNEIHADVMVCSVQTVSRDTRRATLVAAQRSTGPVGLIITDECFPAGTLVGDVPIESIRPGDLAPSWNEETGREEMRPVRHVMRKTPSSLVKLSLEDGRVIHCTPNHPVLTTQGWCPAGGLWRGAMVVSFTHDTTAGVHTMHDRVHRDPEAPDRPAPQERTGLLFGLMPGRLGAQAVFGTDGSDQPGPRLSSDAGTQPHAPSRCPREGVRHAETDRAQTTDAGRQREADAGSTTGAGRVPGVADRVHGDPARRGDAVPLQGGHRAPHDEGVRGGGRGVPLLAGPPILRPAPGRTASLARVAGVQVLEPGGDGTYGGVCPEGVVYNLEVDTTHTYLIDGGLVVHNCHHAPAKSYQDVYASFPDALHAGFTATLERGDGVGLGSVWDDVVFSRSPLWMMKHGYLVQPRAFTEDAAGLDLKSVKRSGGDYSAADLGRALEKADVTASLPQVWKEHAADRPTIVFAPTVATAHGTAEAFRGAGVTSAVVSGETPREERLRIFDDFRTGRVTVLCNCMVLTEGFDAPWASCAVIARPTRSRPLYIQMVGRVLRPWQGKSDAVVINVAGSGGKISTLVDLAPGAVQEVMEGEGLLEAEDREELEAAADEDRREVRARQVLRLKEVQSLFEASHQAWLRTAGGVMFLSAGEYTYFLWANRETPGTWDVCRKAKYGKWERTAHTGLTAEMAMSWAEAEAEDHGSFSVARKASWRGRSIKPSQAQKDFAQQIGIGVPPEMSKAELSDAISYVLESRALDPYLGVV